MVWRDGSAWNYGKFDDPAKPEYSYRREVDYVSGAALMVPRDLFWEVGGFDEHYLPAYYEDVDLALAVREAGRSVVFQPLSQIVHDEGATSGTDLTKGVKARQIENLEKLATRWRQRLSAQFEPGQSIFRARERGVGLRVLVLDHCTPEPDKDAGSFVVFAIMQVLQSLGCKITFVPEDNYLFLERYTTDLQRLGIECLYAPFVTSVQQYLEEHGDAFDLVVIFRFTAASRNLDAIRRLAPRAKVILDPVDLHFLREATRGRSARRRRHAATCGEDQACRARHHQPRRLHRRAQHRRAGTPRARETGRTGEGVHLGPRRARDRSPVRTPARHCLHRGVPASAERGRGALFRDRHLPPRAPADFRCAIPDHRQQSHRGAAEAAE